MDWIVGKEFEDIPRGLFKNIISLQFEKVEKPSSISTCRIKISKVLNLEERPSVYLRRDNEFMLEMGSSVTPIDCYIEILVQNMLLGETSQCQIKTKYGEPITFEITLSGVSPTKFLFQLSIKEIFDLAQKYRCNGVEMFKTYPKFAHDYFSRAAKCLISFKPFESLTIESNGLGGADMEALLQTLQTNLSACLLAEQRYEDVIYLTEFVDSLPLDGIKNIEKAVYRRALAFYNVKAYDKVMAIIEKVDDFQGKKEFVALYNRTKQTRKLDDEHYKSIVQRMFN